MSRVSLRCQFLCGYCATTEALLWCIIKTCGKHWNKLWAERVESFPVIEPGHAGTHTPRPFPQASGLRRSGSKRTEQRTRQARHYDRNHHLFLNTPYNMHYTAGQFQTVNVIIKGVNDPSRSTGILYFVAINNWTYIIKVFQSMLYKTHTRLHKTFCQFQFGSALHSSHKHLTIS